MPYGDHEVVARGTTMLRGMPGRRTAHGALWVLLVGGVGVLSLIHI